MSSHNDDDNDPNSSRTTRKAAAPTSTKRGEARRKKNQLPEYDDIGETPLRGQEKRLVIEAEPQFRAMKLSDRPAQLHHQYDSPAAFLRRGEELTPAGMNVKQQQHETITQPASWRRHPSLQNLTRQRWNTGGWEHSCEFVQPFPMYFPRDNMYEFDAVTLPEVQDRLSTFFFRHGIQASLRAEPCLSATLETCEGDELYLTFFFDPSTSGGKDGKGGNHRRRRSSQHQQAPGLAETDKIYMDVQRKKGDHLRLCQYIFKIVETAKGVGYDDGDADMSEGGDPMIVEAPTPDPSALLAVENLIQRAAASNGNGSDGNANSQIPSQDQYMKSILKQADAWFTAPQLGLHRKAVECLLVLTDLRQCTSSMAVSAALSVLQGTAPSADLSQESQTIQSSILTILLNRELPGDRALLPERSPPSASASASKTDDDDEIRPYFEDDSFVPPSDLPTYYVTYMNEMFHLSLQVLVQALEVVACFHQQVSSVDIQDMARNLFLAASNVAGGKDLYETLLGCVKSAESKLANGYLACKALRLLAMALPSLKDRLKSDDKACSYIGGAIQVGYTSHQLLHVESERLWQTVCSS